MPEACDNPPAHAYLLAGFPRTFLTGVRFLVVVLIASLTNPSVRGEQALVVAIAAAAVAIAFIGVGTSLAVLGNDPERGTHYASMGLTLSGFSAVLCVVGCYGVLSMAYSFDDRAVLWSGSVLGATQGVNISIRRLQQSHNDLRGMAWGQVVEGVLLLGAITYVLVSFGDPPAANLLMAYAAASSATLFASVGISWRHVCGLPPPALVDVKPVLKLGLRSYPEHVVTQLNVRIDVMYLGGVISMASLGVYTVAVPVAEVAWLIPMAFGTVLLPQFTAMGVTARSYRLLRDESLRVMILATLSLTVLAGLLFMGRDVAIMQEYRDLWVIVAVLAPGIIGYSGVYTVTAYLTGAARRPELGLILIAAGLAVQLIGLAVLVPLLGTIGAAVASSLGYCVAGGTGHRIARRVSAHVA